jgi:hypothetical protein
MANRKPTTLSRVSVPDSTPLQNVLVFAAGIRTIRGIQFLPLLAPKVVINARKSIKYKERAIQPE